MPGDETEGFEGQVEGMETYKNRNLCKILGFIIFAIISIDNLWKRNGQIGGGIILLLGAPVKSKFDGLKSREHR